MAESAAGEATPVAQTSSAWLDVVGRRCLAEAWEFAAARAAEHFAGRAEGLLAETALPDFVAGGKCLRPLFAYVGWCCGKAESDAALRAAASLELLHCFALAQDDVMDQSPVRRGRPALQARFARWHADQGWRGSARRVGDSAAILAGDLFLVWAEQMLRGSGLDPTALARGWPHYDRMRSELAVGQLADLVGDARALPSWETALDVLRRKSGNYTVRRPLEFGAALAGCDAAGLDRLGEFGGLVGEAFQLRDDLLGVFGDAAATGKPDGQDLREHKASSVVVLAARMAGPRQRAALAEVAAVEDVDDGVVDRWRGLIVATGARERMEELIRERTEKAIAAADAAVIPRHALGLLAELATRSTERTR
ncbi:polyprenyl synthetase family protein [Amycolatopsis nivea]